MEEKKISIVIPVYNSERYIGECIESIQKQTYSNIEIIIVDDGSKDNSAQIIKEYQNNYKNIKYFFQENKGASIARNLGINNATGDYIMFLDSDDILKENAIKTMSDTMNKENSQLVLGNYEEITEDKVKIKESIEHRKIEKYEEDGVFKCATFVPYPGNKLYDNTLIKKFNIEFANVGIGQDLNFFIKYIAYCNRIITIPNIVAQYRIVNGGISRTYSLKALDIIKTMNDIKKRYCELNLQEIYHKYISIVELINYNAQLRKVVYYKEKIDRKIITLFMKKYASKIKLDKDTYYGAYKNIVIKFWIKIRLSFIYNSNLTSKYFCQKKQKEEK